MQPEPTASLSLASRTFGLIAVMAIRLSDSFDFVEARVLTNTVGSLPASGNRLRLRKVTMMASSLKVRTVERNSVGP